MQESIILNKISGYTLGNRNIVTNLEKWMEFFIYVGKYSERHNNITIFLSYIDDVLPLPFLSLGIIDEKLTFYQDNKKELYKIISNKVDSKEELLFFTNEGYWRKAKVIGFKNLEYMPSKFNPYIVVEILYPGKANVKEKIPVTKWTELIRFTNQYKSTSGSKTIFNDEVPEFLSAAIANDLLNLLKTSNQQFINIIGFNYKNTFNEYLKNIRFKTGTVRNRKMSDIILNDDSEYSYINTKMINNLTDFSQGDAVNLYVGPTALINSTFKNNRSIYIINRNKNDFEKRELAIDKFIRNLRSSLNYTEQFIEYLNNHNIEIPKGVECYVSRKNKPT